MRQVLQFVPLLLAIPALAEVTIGPGPSIGTDCHGAVWFEEFQDWSPSDLRALDPAGDQHRASAPAAHSSGDESESRDLVAFYQKSEGDNMYFRVDLFDLAGPADDRLVEVYVAVDCAPGGQSWLPDLVETRLQDGDGWEVCVAVRSRELGVVYDSSFVDVASSGYLGSYWSQDLDSIEFGVRKSTLTEAGWDGVSPLRFWVFTTRDGTKSGAGELEGSDVADLVETPDTKLVRASPEDPALGRVLGAGIESTAVAGRAKYAAIAHANQSIAMVSGTQDHIHKPRPELGLCPGFARTLDSHEMLGMPLNMHLSGSMLSSMLWAEEPPSSPSFPQRDGPSFVARVKKFVDAGIGSIIGGVYGEHIMPYFEGEVNIASMNAFGDLARGVFGLSPADMKVMHIPERVMHSDSGWTHADPSGPLRGTPLKDIISGGYEAAYLDEVSHLHWWFYPTQTNNPAWDDSHFGRWSGYGGNDDEPYHHKIHRMHGVMLFMINDREDNAKFDVDGGGMSRDTRRSLLEKAMSPDQAQITVVFDDWEAFAGNSFLPAVPNNNADQWHATIRWTANKQWIQVVNLREALEWARKDPSWTIDHGSPDRKSSQTYEWLKRASGGSYDNWYYGSALEESFFDRVPPVSPDGASPSGMKKYGDMNTPATLIRDTWDRVRSMPPGSLRRLAEISFSSMIYETAWHDEDADPTMYRSRNYQVDFDRDAPGLVSRRDTTYDKISDWALKLHGAIRRVGVIAAASEWGSSVKSGNRPPKTVVEARDIDDDTQAEYILYNDRVFLCFERWGGRLVAAFSRSPSSGEVVQVIGAPASYPPAEHEGEFADDSRCSAFKDRFASGAGDYRYVDMDYAASPPRLGEDFVEFRSSDGKITKRIVLQDGKDIVTGIYRLDPSVGKLYVRHGLGPNQLDLLLNGPANLKSFSGKLFYGLRNSAGGEVYAAASRTSELRRGDLPNAGYRNRQLPLVEQVEVHSREGAHEFSTSLAFSRPSAEEASTGPLPAISAEFNPPAHPPSAPAQSSHARRGASAQ